MDSSWLFHHPNPFQSVRTSFNLAIQFENFDYNHLALVRTNFSWFEHLLESSYLLLKLNWDHLEMSAADLSYQLFFQLTVSYLSLSKLKVLSAKHFCRFAPCETFPTNLNSLEILKLSQALCLYIFIQLIFQC